MDKQKLATLIEAYADAKASGNKYLISRIVSELEVAMDMIFSPQDPGLVDVDSETEKEE